MSIVVANQRNSKKKKPRSTEEELQFARDTFDAFAPYFSHGCWGINKRHTITKAEFVAFNQWCEERNGGVEKPKIVIRNEQGRPWVDENDQPIFFNYYLNYKSNLWTPDAISPALNGEELYYYMSPARAGKKFLYGDLDAHIEWQDDLPEAIALLKELFKESPFYRFSHGGYNAWLKIGDAPTANEYNTGLARMERVLKDAFIAIDHHRYQYVPDAKGQCKGIWIREQETVGERNYSFPSDVLPLVPPCIRVMTLVIDREDGWSSQIRESRPPP